MLLFSASDFASFTSHIHNWVLFLLWLCLFIFSWSYFSTDLPVAYWAPTNLGSSSFSVLLSFCLFICLWDSQGKNTEVVCHFLLHCIKLKSEIEVAQLCPTLSDPMDCSPQGSSIHGIFQARVLEWSAIAFSDMLLEING